MLRHQCRTKAKVTSQKGSSSGDVKKPNFDQISEEELQPVFMVKYNNFDFLKETSGNDHLLLKRFDSSDVHLDMFVSFHISCVNLGFKSRDMIHIVPVMLHT